MTYCIRAQVPDGLMLHRGEAQKAQAERERGEGAAEGASWVEIERFKHRQVRVMTNSVYFICYIFFIFDYRYIYIQ